MFFYKMNTIFFTNVWLIDYVLCPTLIYTTDMGFSLQGLKYLQVSIQMITLELALVN